MKIVHFSNADTWSGAEVMLLNLVSGDSANNHMLICAPGRFATHAVGLGHDVRTCRWISRMNRRPDDNSAVVYLWYLSKLLLANFWVWRLICRERPDLVQVVHVSAALNLLLAFVLLRCPLVVWQHDIHDHRFIFDAWIYGLVGRMAWTFVAVSKAVAAHLRQLGIAAEKIVYVHNGIDARVYSEDPGAAAHFRARHGLASRAVVMALVAALVDWKGHMLLLDAVELLRRRPTAKDWQLVLVGGRLQDGIVLSRELEARIRSSEFRDRVRVLGRISNMRELYAGVDIVINASTRPEPFGLTLCEGMAMSRLVVGPAVGGPAEIIDHGRTGLLFRSGDSQDLADVLETAIALAGEGRIEAQAAAEVRNRFSLEGFIKSFQTLYQRYGNSEGGIH